MRIVHYLANTPDIGLNFDGKKPIEPKIYADASHGSHHDARGHGGIIITLGSAPVLSRSYKIKAATRSSSESELFVLEEASTYAVWMRLLLKELGLPYSQPIPTYQDNKSTIIMATTGGSFKRTKHIIARESFVRERVENKDIILKYLPTKDMLADMLTKALDKATMIRFMQLLSVHA
jgi:hypothetical protein